MVNNLHEQLERNRFYAAYPFSWELKLKETFFMGELVDWRTIFTKEDVMNYPIDVNFFMVFIRHPGYSKEFISNLLRDAHLGEFIRNRMPQGHSIARGRYSNTSFTYSSADLTVGSTPEEVTGLLPLRNAIYHLDSAVRKPEDRIAGIGY